MTGLLAFSDMNSDKRLSWFNFLLHAVFVYIYWQKLLCPVMHHEIIIKNVLRYLTHLYKKKINFH